MPPLLPTGPRLKQGIKQSAYRSIGELGALARGRTQEPALRVLMYHKVDDLPGNPATVPVGVFAAQMRQLAELGYAPVDLGAVVAHYAGGIALPPNAVLITFDDGYRDVLVNALPVLERHGFPAVVFVSTAHLGTDEPFPHDRRLLAEHGIRNPALTWDEALELDARGVAVESHGVTHRPLAALEPDEARQEIFESKRELEGRLGRAVGAYAYVKGSAAHFRPEHEALVAEAGYAVAFATFARGNAADANRYRLGRYNGEAYSPRTFELLLRGACDAIAAKDSVAGARAKSLFNRALRTTTG